MDIHSERMNFGPYLTPYKKINKNFNVRPKAFFPLPSSRGCIPWVVAHSAIMRSSMTGLVFFPLHHSGTGSSASRFAFNICCGYIGPTWIVQNNPLTLRSLTSNPNYICCFNSLIPCKATYS